jgi:cathepsin F
VYSTLSIDEKRELFVKFMSDYKKVYAETREEDDRFSVFLSNLIRIDQRNEDERMAGGSAIHGITQFADLTPDEFQSKHLGALLVAPSEFDGVAPPVPGTIRFAARGVPSARNWTGIYTTPIKNQGKCRILYLPLPLTLSNFVL